MKIVSKGYVHDLRTKQSTADDPTFEFRMFDEAGALDVLVYAMNGDRSRIPRIAAGDEVVVAGSVLSAFTEADRATLGTICVDADWVGVTAEAARKAERLPDSVPDELFDVQRILAPQVLGVSPRMKAHLNQEYLLRLLEPQPEAVLYLRWADGSSCEFPMGEYARRPVVRHSDLQLDLSAEDLIAAYRLARQRLVADVAESLFNFSEN